ncbi:MAG: hypothetical protein ACRDNF_00880 [Streptosporangiaceae bacterium]
MMVTAVAGAPEVGASLVIFAVTSVVARPIEDVPSLGESPLL